MADVGYRWLCLDKHGADLEQSSLADFAKLRLLFWATSHAVCLVLLLTGLIRMVGLEDKHAVRLLIMIGFIQRSQAANWLNVAALVATSFCLLSFLILPVKWTHRHYLSICLAIAVGFMEVWWVETIIAACADCHSLHSSYL